MNTNVLIHRACAVMAALIASTAGAFASAVPKPTGYFTRVGVAYAEPSDGGVDSGFGVMAQLGASYDAGEFSLEVGQFRFDEHERFDFGDGYIVNAQAELRASPLMVSGRYGVRFGSQKQVIVRFGAAGGVAHLRVSAHASDGEVEEGFTTSEWALAYAGDITIAYVLSQKLEISAAYRYIVAASTTWDYAGVEIESGDLKASLFSIGLAYRW